MHVGDRGFGVGCVCVYYVGGASIGHDCLGHYLGLEEDEADLHCLFIGRSSSRMGPYAPKISRKWLSLTFLVSFSTTIYATSAINLASHLDRVLTFELFDTGDARLRLRV